MSVLKPEGSMMAGLATAAVVYGIYQSALPSIADARSAQAGNKDLDASERSAGFIAAGVVAGVSLIAKDPTIFILGGSMVVAMSWWHRHANMVIPELGQAVPHFTNESNQVDAQAQADSNVYDMGSYETSA
jgi:hypothetical protein